MALGLSMIYESTHEVNFAQGEMAMFSTYIALTFINIGLPYWVSFGLTVCLSFLIGMIIEFAIIRPMYKAPILSVVVVYIGLLVFFHSIAGLLFGFSVVQFPSPFEAWFHGRYISGHQIGAI